MREIHYDDRSFFCVFLQGTMMKLRLSFDKVVGGDRMQKVILHIMMVPSGLPFSA
jgi:hypothetical protein